MRKNDPGVPAGWESLFRPHILRRGADYYAEGAVRELSWDGECVTATVAGGELYEVTLWLEGGQIDGMICTCPYAEEDNACKHMAAVLYALKDGASPVPDKGTPPLEELVAAMAAKDARALLLELAREDELIAVRVAARTCQKIAPNQMARLKRKIDELTRKMGDRHGFIDYYHADEYISALEDFLDRQARPLMEQGLPMDAFELTGYVFETAARCEIDDSGGGLTMLCSSCGALWEELAGRASEEEQDAMYGWFEQARSDPGIIDFMADELRDVSLRIFRSPKLLRRGMGQIDRDIRAVEQSKDSDWGRQYRLSELVLHRLRLMEELELGEAEIGAFVQRYFFLPDVRRREVDRLEQEKQYGQAIALLRQSKELDQESPGLVDEHSQRLLRIFRELGDKDSLLEELRFHIFHCRQDDLSQIHALKELTSEAEWEPLREEILAARTVYMVELRLLESEGLYERLLQEVLARKNLFSMEKYVQTLSSRYPEEVAAFYAVHLNEEMRRADNRKQYRRVIAYLKTLRRFSEGGQTARELAAQWRQTYPRRRSMLDELDKAGFAGKL